jgi:hypothetical protein
MMPAFSWFGEYDLDMLVPTLWPRREYAQRRTGLSNNCIAESNPP